MKRSLSLFLLVLTLVPAGAASAEMLFQSYDAKKHDRFYVGDDKAFIGGSYDWSGVGRGSRWATMISPTYFLSATHYHPADNSTLNFYYANNPADGCETRTVLSGVQIAGTDLWLGKLSEAVGSQVAIYPVLSLPELSEFNDRELYVLGRSNTSPEQTNVRLGRNNIDADSYELQSESPSEGMVYTFDFDTVGGQGGDECYLQAYDSGGSSFAIVDGAPALLGIHWFIDEDDETGKKYSGDTFVSYYIDEINAAMSGGQLTIVPEPGTWTMLLGAALAWLFHRRRRNAK